MRPTAHELRVMAAALETPDDLTADELAHANADILDYLLAQAEIAEVRPWTGSLEILNGNCTVCGRPQQTRKGCTC